jgi:hypothetical protein
MSNKYFILESNKKYYAAIIDNESNYIINIGGIKNICVSIEINKDTSVNIAIIQTLGYHQRCVISDLLEKNKDMINLIQISLLFTVYNFSHINQFIFTDNSYVKCENKTILSLADLSYVKYKKTWYEKNFNAIPKNENKVNEYKLKIDKNLIRKLKYSKELFIETFYTDYNEDLKFISFIKKNYYENILLNDFLQKLLKKDCSYYSNIFNLFIGNKLKGTEWIINYNSNNNLDCNLIELDKPLKKHKIIISNVNNEINDIFIGGFPEHFL